MDQVGIGRGGDVWLGDSGLGNDSANLAVGTAGHQPAMESPGAQQLCVPLAIRSGS